jgi:type I restriction enzyme R subunit
MKEHPGIGKILDWNPEAGGPVFLPISNHPDQVIEVSRGYGDGQKPADFLDSFSAFIRDHINEISALRVVVQRPRDLTRAELKALRLALDGHGYSEPKLRKAWSETKNEDIAASIVGFIRQAALGDALTPMETLVEKAMRRILAKQPWTDVQRRWLRRIGDQLTREVVVDRSSLDEEPFRADGGFNRLNKIFEGQLETVLGDISEELWKKTA